LCAAATMSEGDRQPFYQHGPFSLCRDRGQSTRNSCCRTDQLMMDLFS
jgi:hypothetical protein